MYPQTANKLTDPAPATAFAHLDATIILSRELAAKGIYPAVERINKVPKAKEIDVLLFVMH